MSKTMRALVKERPEKGLTLKAVPVPSIGPNDVLIRILHAAVCGTDLHIYHWDKWAEKTLKPPLVVGHEFMGEIVEVGSHVEGYRIGDRVSGEGHITCGHCRNCRGGRRHLCRNTKGIGVNRDGCFADFLSLPASNLFKLPKAIPDAVAAFLDPLGNAVHTALSFDLVGEDVLITGSGPIGIMATAIAKHVGARFVVVTDVNDMRLSLAKKCGADRVVNVARGETPRQAMNELGMTEGYDVCLEMSGQKKAFDDIFSTINHGGKIAVLGIPSESIPVNFNDIIFKGLTMKGIYGREMFETWYKMSSMLQSGLDVSPVLTHHIDVEKWEEGFRAASSQEAAKVVLRWAQP